MQTDHDADKEALDSLVTVLILVVLLAIFW